LLLPGRDLVEAFGQFGKAAAGEVLAGLGVAGGGGGRRAYSGRGFEASGGRGMAEGGFADIGGGADVAAR
ncbi:S1 family peptidase, partial [Kitasatospora sp. NPDC005751]